MLLEWGQFDMRKGNLLNQLLRLEEAFADNEKTGSKLEDTIKLTILMKCVSGQWKTWLQLNVSERARTTCSGKPSSSMTTPLSNGAAL